MIFELWFAGGMVGWLVLCRAVPYVADTAAAVRRIESYVTWAACDNVVLVSDLVSCGVGRAGVT